MQEIYCAWEPSEFLFISSNVPELVHYSHGVAIFAALVISVTIFIGAPRQRVSQLFLLFSLLFSFWAALDMILWATNDPATVMFSWSLQILLEPLTFATAFYLFYIFLVKRLPSFKYNLLSFLIFLPILIFLPTTLNLEGLLLETCESIEGPLAKYYSYFANSSYLLLIILTGILHIPRQKNSKQKLSAIYFLIGLVTFLLSFVSGNILSSFTDDWTISQYGLFAMPVFALLIAYSIVRFNAFNTKLVGTQVLVVILWTLVAALLLVVQSDTSRLVALLTLGFTTIFGYLLIKSVKKEIQQREQIQKLAVGLEKANERLKELDKQKSEFVSIASHQLRSPLTALRGYASMLIEGSFGPVTDKQKQVLAQIQDSGKMMASSIEDYLSISRIESGNMKYEMSEFNLKDLTQSLVEELQSEATKAGLILHFASELDGEGVVNADKGKTFQIIHNLVNNSLKYTPKGTVTVLIKDDAATKTISVNISDTGIGMNQATIAKLFEKFSRADNANSVNIKGTGLGLYVARLLARAMKGDVSAHSEGDNKGSTFTFTIPYVR